MSEPDYTAPVITSIAVTEASDWQCAIVEGFVLHPNKGDEPNAFHRLMQRLVLGFRWRKVA